MIVLWISSVLAGEIFVTECGDVFNLDTRSFANHFDASTRYCGAVAGLAYDPQSDTLWVDSTGPGATLISVDRRTQTRTDWGSIGAIATHALAFDPLVGVLSFNSIVRGGVFERPGGVLLSGTPLTFGAADYFDDGGYVVAIEQSSGDWYSSLVGGSPTFLAPAPAGVASPVVVAGLAYDKDTRLFWQFDTYRGDIWLIEPENFSVVGHLFTPGVLDGAGGSIDNVQPQTPELLATGHCAGTVYLTVVDATPGGQVLIGSAPQAGSKTLRGGACAGTRLGLRNPTQRYDLIANSYGVASVAVQLPAGVCNQPEPLFQALDVDSCLTTSVRSQRVWLP